jgi:hypothetical protein
VLEAATLTTGELEKLYDWRSTVEKFFKGVCEELERRAKLGEKLKLQKLVEGRSFRVFKSKDKAVDVLVGLGLDRDDLVKEEMASPAEVERLLIAAGHKRKDVPDLLKDLVFRPPGKATLASIRDGRPALADQYDDAFSDV